MNSLPVPALVAACAALIALPFSLAAGGTLLMTASLGFIIHADYAGRCRRVRLPRLSARASVAPANAQVTREVHPFAA